jgi:hypothetical protein
VGNVLRVTSNGIIPYTFVQTTPNPLTAGTYVYKIPLTAAVAAQTTALPLLGPVAVAVNGMTIAGPNEASMPPAQAYGDPVYNGITDPCLGHTAMSYHYHALSQQCLVQASVTVATPWTLPAPSPDHASPILGWSLDGFPIRGRYECSDAVCSDVVELTSGWQQTGNPTTYAWSAYTYVASTSATVLDKCNGHVGPHGDYHYHATTGFPYVLGCYRGTPAAQAGP